MIIKVPAGGAGVQDCRRETSRQLVTVGLKTKRLAFAFKCSSAKYCCALWQCTRPPPAVRSEHFLSPELSALGGLVNTRFM